MTSGHRWHRPGLILGDMGIAAGIAHHDFLGTTLEVSIRHPAIEPSSKITRRGCGTDSINSRN